VREAMERVKPSLPARMEYSIPFDTTKFVDRRSRGVHDADRGRRAGAHRHPVFLQSWRAVLVPATTVPVTIIGAFAFMPVLGFSVTC
jgi:hydrophobic/amphiphilic exporter-1 (mainly G- bacteria), HAE1 family